MSILLGLWKLFGSRPIQSFLLASRDWLLLLFIIFGIKAGYDMRNLRDWRNEVTTALSSAVNQHDRKGNLLAVKPNDAVAHILALGRFRADVETAQAKAAAQDAQHVVTVAKADAAISRKGSDDFDSRLARARADAKALRALPPHIAGPAARPVSAAAHGLQPSGSAPAGRSGDGADPAMPGLSAAVGEADASPGANGLSAPACAPLSLDERLLATEQAIQLDELISTIESFAKVKR